MVMMVIRTSFDMGSLSYDHQESRNHDHQIYSYSSDELSSSSEESDLVGDDSSDSSSPEAAASPPASPKVQDGPLGDMSSLLQQLPFKRGLSKYFHGKSQSFTSLSSVTCLEDLAKPENPYHKKLKSCKTYVGELSESAAAAMPHPSSQLPNLKSIAKKSSRVSGLGSCSNNAALGGGAIRRNGGSFIGGGGNNIAMRPPTHPPHRSNSAANFSNQTPLIA